MKKSVIILYLLLMGISLSVNAQSFPKAILRGDYPDPGILREGKDYYMTHSPFTYSPGFLIWHSTDLQNWEPVTRAMPELVGSAMAPGLVEYKGTYYIYFPGKDALIYAIYAKNISGPWSAPKALNIPAGSIDPGHVVGEDGKRYLFLNDGKVVQLSDDGLSAVTKPKQVYDGWAYPGSWKVECKCLESPKLIKHGEYYYLVTAEGGTAGPATSHMVIAARSKSIFGPWENSPNNPIVHTYNSDDRWWSKGHGTLIDDVNGNWWIVYHAYLNGYYALGRQTLIEPIEWTSDGWFKTKSSQPFPGNSNKKYAYESQLSDDFTSGHLNWQWTSWNGIDSNTAKFDKGLLLKAKGASPIDGQILLTTVPDTNYAAEVEVTIPAENKGGLILFYSEKAFAGIVADANEMDIYSNAETKNTISNKFGKHFFLQIINKQNHCDFLVSKDGRTWNTLQSGIDVSMMNHNVYKHFLALRIGLVSCGIEGAVKFNKFKYRTNTIITGNE